MLKQQRNIIISAIVLFIVSVTLFICVNIQYSEIQDLKAQITEMQVQIFSLNESINSNMKEISSQDKIIIDQDYSINNLKTELTEKNKQYNELLIMNKNLITDLQKSKSEINNLKKKINRGESRAVTIPKGSWKVTAYDLSFASCGKHPGDSGYGITATGYSLVGKNRSQAMTVACDPNILKLGTKVYITFRNGFKSWNGVYTCRDTGGAVKGKVLDLYVGVNQHELTDSFGIRYADVSIVK